MGSTLHFRLLLRSCARLATKPMINVNKLVLNQELVNVSISGKSLPTSFHTSALQFADAPPALYDNVPQVFDRIKLIASAEMVEKVKACYTFQIEGTETKFYVDFKEGDGQVGEGEVPNKPDGFKPEVRITMTEENMLKMFNRELAPATAFMTGKLKLSGELSKALALESVLKAAREKSEADAKK